jgi:hypothetical protein
MALGEGAHLMGVGSKTVTREGEPLKLTTWNNYTYPYSTLLRSRQSGDLGELC